MSRSPHLRSLFSVATLFGCAALLATGCPATPEETPPAKEFLPARAPAEPVDPAASAPPADVPVASVPAAPSDPLDEPPTTPLAPADVPADAPTDAPLAPAVEPTDVPLANNDPATGAHETDEHEAGGYEAGHKPAKDPVALNGPIFVDWPKPAAAILISGEQIGYMEPCGCAGLENQKGGLKRRHALVDSLREKGWPLVAFDLGGQVRRFGRQAEIKFSRTLGALVEMDYQAVALGAPELRLPAEHVLSVAANLAEGEQAAKPLVSANVGVLDFDLGYVEPYRVVQVGNRRIGVTSILGKEYQADINNADVLFRDPAEALRKVLPALKKEADFLVLLAHATPEESKALAREFPEFDIVVTAGGAEEPPAVPEAIEGSKAKLIQVGHKGMYVAVLGLYDDETTPLRYQRVPLDARFPDSPAMQEVLVEYQKELETLGLIGLGIKSQLHTSGHKFAGSKACADCHSSAYEVWVNSPHAHATQTLVDLKPARHFDPECLSCHVTGWDPQNYFPFASGYRDLEETKHLRTNGCENCHGPAAEHVAAELGEVELSDEEIAKLRQALQLKLEPGEAEGEAPTGAVTLMCMQCHDLDNSPDFDFKTYWPEVEHHGKD